MDILERQVFTGPPENPRDHVLVASRKLMSGDWRTCASLLLERLDVWNLIPGEGAADAVKGMLLMKIKCEALRTYLFAYSSQYDSLSLPHLCEMFDLDKRTAHGVVSKMMINQVFRPTRFSVRV
jgi:translation initiation factor 3 subunit C